MKKKLPEPLLQEFCSFMEENTGWYFPQKDWDHLSQKLDSISEAFQFEDPKACIKWLMQTELSRDQIGVLARYLTIGETYFFRDAAVFETLENVILPSLIKQKEKEGKKIKIWSAACSTGEEPYSIAILLNKLLKYSDGWDVQIIGTDINGDFLRKAQSGQYKEWSFRTIPERIKAQYFHETAPSRYAIDPNIQKIVDFQYLNLVEDSYPSILNRLNAVDIIFCNNVLIYFSNEQIQGVIRKMVNTLNEGGWLIVTPIEAPYVEHEHLKKVSAQGSHYFVKSWSSSLPPNISKLPHPPSKKSSSLPQNFRIELPAFIHPPQAAIEVQFSPVKPPEVPVASPPSQRSVATAPSPVDRKAFHEECDALFKQGEYEKVIQLIERLSIQNTLRFIEMALLAKAYANLGKFPIAVSWIEKALKLEKMDPSLHFLHGILLAEQGNDHAAEKALKKTLYLDPDFILAHFALGNLCRKQNKKTEMDRHFRNVLQMLSHLPPETPLKGEEGMTAAHLKTSIEYMQTNNQ